MKTTIKGLAEMKAVVDAAKQEYTDGKAKDRDRLFRVFYGLEVDYIKACVRHVEYLVALRVARESLKARQQRPPVGVDWDDNGQTGAGGGGGGVGEEDVRPQVG